ncbi:DUF2325 domain-containing protein [Ideonella sp.]|uniref:DUF2325 domain-containing protein n=1 Tax=Ideonella sp. TaxID=1929293 RepID=UPI003BB61DE1
MCRSATPPVPEPSPAQDESLQRSAAQTAGSRRRRIWELPTHALCPVVGVCLPMAALRQLVDREVGGKTVASDYELHCGVNAECKQRGPISEQVQRELERRYGVAVGQARQLKTRADLAQWWAQQRTLGSSVAGSLWAVLTHARCDHDLQEQVLQDVHMLQHQNGAADRADHARVQALLKENHVLARELAAAQQRSTQQTTQHARRVEELESRLMQAQASLISRDTLLAEARQQLQALTEAAPGLPERLALQERLQAQLSRTQQLERELTRARTALERASSAPTARPDLEPPPPPLNHADLQDLPSPAAHHTVLCVGGRPGSVASYRRMIETTGAQFLHHDGGKEDQVTRLDSTLQAAQLVICQTGCISHDAYWRVKEHCLRTGKRCVFLANPGHSSFKRALMQLFPARPEPVSR